MDKSCAVGLEALVTMKDGKYNVRGKKTCSFKSVVLVLMRSTLGVQNLRVASK